MVPLMASPPFTSEQLLAAPAGFSCPLTARFQDCDAAGILFYARVFDYFHDAYVAFLATTAHPLPATLAARKVIAPMRHTEADYLRPIRFGDAIAVELVKARFEGSVLTLGYRVLGADGAPAAIGQTVHVWVDAATFKRAAPPSDLVEAFSRMA